MVVMLAALRAPLARGTLLSMRCLTGADHQIRLLAAWPAHRYHGTATTSEEESSRFPDIDKARLSSAPVATSMMAPHGLNGKAAQRDTWTGAASDRLMTATAALGGAAFLMPSVLCDDGGLSTGTVLTAAGFTLPVFAVTALQVAGPLLFLSLQISGAAASRQILRDKSVGGLSLLPPLSLLTSCVIWMFYGHMIDDFTVMGPNISGAAFGLIYSAIYLKHSTSVSKHIPMLAGSALIIGGVAAAAVTMPAAAIVSKIGLLGDVLAVIMMAAPLASIKTVIAEKSTRALPFPISLATLLNGTCWTLYGSLVMGDPLIWVPNALGFTAAMVQMGLFAKYGIYREPSAADKSKEG